MGDNNGLISIILPVYNVEDYLDECVQSILRQTYGKFELIMVDDGSQDKSGIMCDDYAQMDSRIVVIHKPNGGLSDARNTGIEKANGEYITFIDSDDVVSLSYLEILYSVTLKTGVDLSQCKFTRSKNDLNCDDVPFKENDVLRDVMCFTREMAFMDFLYRKNLYVSSCAKLYRRELFEDIRFPVGYLNEDNFTTYKLVYKARKSASINKPLYWHRINRGSIMQSGFSEKKMMVRTVPDEMERFLGEECKRYQDGLDYYRFRQNLSLYNRMLAKTLKTDYEKEKKELKKEISEFKIEGDGNIKFKMVHVVFRYAHPVYIKFIQWMFKKGKIS